MTDITELAQLRAELSNPANGSKDHLRKLALLLVEALERKEEQRANWFQMAQKLGEDLDAAEKRIAELESFRTAYMEWSDKTDWVQTDKRFYVVRPLGKHRADVLKAYIEHLESRAVKLPKPYAYLRENDGQIQISIGAERPSDCSGGYATPWFAIYTAAGIKVEAE